MRLDIRCKVELTDNWIVFKAPLINTETNLIANILFNMIYTSEHIKNQLQRRKHTTAHYIINSLQITLRSFEGELENILVNWDGKNQVQLTFIDILYFQQLSHSNQDSTLSNLFQ